MRYRWLRRVCFGSFAGLAILVLAGCGSDDNGVGGVAKVTYSISGQVTSAGAGLSGVTLTLSGAASATTATSATGNYSFTGLDNGAYTITPARTGFTFSPASSPATVGGANVTGVNFTATSTQSAQIVPCPPSGTTNVTIVDFSYTPDNVTISANGIVKWTNNGLSIHTVTSGTPPTQDGKFNSGDLGTGGTVCVQFPAPGTYPYFCIPHPFMIGSVTVTAPAAVVIRFASLDNTQETTGVGSAAKGAGVLAVDTATGRIAGFLVHNVTNTTQSHIHVGARGVAGGILVPLAPVSAGSPNLYAVPDNTFFPNPATDVASFLAGNLYFNVHSSNPLGAAGEIRGQIDMTPTTIRFASLDNTQETTGVGSAAKGAGVLAVDTATGRIAGFLAHNVTNTTQSHIHVGARGVAGGILVPLAPVSAGSPNLYAVPDNTFFPNPATDVASFLAGNLYFNVHSSNPLGAAGEIRGQIDLP